MCHTCALEMRSWQGAIQIHVYLYLTHSTWFVFWWSLSYLLIINVNQSINQCLLSVHSITWNDKELTFKAVSLSTADTTALQVKLLFLLFNSYCTLKVRFSCYLKLTVIEYNFRVLDFYWFVWIIRQSLPFIVSNEVQLVYLTCRQFCSWWHLVKCGTISELHHSWRMTHAVEVQWVIISLSVLMSDSNIGLLKINRTVTRLGLSLWDPYAMHRGGCLELYYCNMVEWSTLTRLVWSYYLWKSSSPIWPIMCLVGR